MRKSVPLLLAILLSFALHALLVAFVMKTSPVPGEIPGPQPSEISLGPQIEPLPLEAASSEPQRQDASPAASPAVDLPPPVQDLTAAPVPEVTPLTPVETKENAETPSDAKTASAAGEVKRDSSAPEIRASAAADARLADAPQIQSRSPDIVAAQQPGEGSLFAPNAAEIVSLTPSPVGEALTLPAISSDDAIKPAAEASEVTPQTIGPSEPQSVIGAEPSPTVDRSNPANALPVQKARPLPPAPRPPPAQAPAQAQRGANEIYDPKVRGGYVSSLSSHLRRQLVFPSTGETGTVIVRFVLDRSGHILTRLIVGSSGSPSLDAAALAMVSRSAPFPVFPSGFGSSQLEVTLPIHFNAP